MSRDPYDDDSRDDPDRAERERDPDDGRRAGRDERAIRAAKSRVIAPAIGLILVAAFGIFSVVMGLIQFPTLDAQFDEEVQKVENNPNIPAAQKREQVQMLNQFREWAKVGWVPFYALVGVFSAVTLAGAIQLMSLSGRLLPTAAAVLSFLPCTSGCCVLGLVFGIWALVVMSQPEVKAGFAARRRAAYSPDPY